MSANGKRASSSTLGEETPGSEDARMSLSKQPKLGTASDVHDDGSQPAVSGINGEASKGNPYYRIAPADLLEQAAVLQQLKAEIISDLRARVTYPQLHATADLQSIGAAQPDTVTMGQVPEEPEVERKAATPMLNRCNWVEFKNLYLEESIYAVDVLMGPPKFYWHRRAEEREMRDRIETAKTYSSEAKIKALERDREKTGFNVQTGTTDGTLPNGAEMPERIRINSQPLLAILSEIADERWGDEPKVILRPYKLLVAHEEDIRKRLKVLQSLWAKRQKPDDVTKALGNVPTYEPDTLDDASIAADDSSLWRGQHSVSSLSSHERRARRRLDLTTTYDALEDLKVLVEFLDVDVMPVVRQYAPHSPNPNPKIHFRDLWYLYRPGDWVVLDERRGKRFSPDANADGEHPSNQPVNIGERVATLWRVLRTANGRPKLSPANKHERNRQPASEVNPFSIRCYRIDFDGDRFGPIWVDFDYQPWSGERMIESLEIVPLRLVKERDQIWQRFVERGHRFMELRTPQHRVYSGPLVNHHPSGLIFEHSAPGQKDVYGSVIVDFKETARVHPNMVLKLGFADSSIEYADDDLTFNEDYPLYAWVDRKAGRWSERVDEIFDDAPVDERLRHDHVRKDPFLSQYDSLLQGDYIDGSDFGDNELALLPVRVCAYILQRRRFALLRLDKMRGHGSDSSNWDDLHLHRDNKETVKAQTMSHFRNKSLRRRFPDMKFDLSQEKGMGLIILLHGVPGVGKTSTAECVAQLLGKPLFPITCGDLGTTASEVDATLNEIFSKAEKWDCVLLLDEADVFLTSRDKGDLHRNAVVSVFLRILELYTGVLILTTNRIGVLDEAFMSRCHTQLYYPPLDEDQTLKIWETNLKRLQKRKGATMHVALDRILEFAKRHYHHNPDSITRWNGRQIRNACQAAAALAEHDIYGQSEFCPSPAHDPSQPQVRLDVNHFMKVDAAMREFHEYMSNVCGDSFAGVANTRGERYDDYKPPSKSIDHGYGPGPSPRMGPGDDGYSAWGAPHGRPPPPTYGTQDTHAGSRWARDRGPSFGDQDRPQWSPH